MSTNNLSRRRFMQLAGVSGAASLSLLYGGCKSSAGKRVKSSANGKKVIVIGIDGMDPRLCERLMDRGEMPNLNRLRQAGGYKPLGTTTPPQSPVAWASFIIGADAGVHGIFDFIHRDPDKQCMPFFAAANTVGGEEGWEVGDHKIPLPFWPFNHSPSETLLCRGGTPFWDYLDEAGIPAWIYDIPSNYPPSPSKHGHQFCLSGMGTVDLLGGYGTYQSFSSKRQKTRHPGGGIHKPLRFNNNAAKAVLTGPKNSLLKKPVDTEVEFEIYRHPKEPLARIEFQDQTIMLKEGEWSQWQRVTFPLKMPSFLPDDEIGGICRFLLQEVHPNFRLYVTPINIDPSNPGEMKITEPSDFVEQISDELGLFYTTGFQEDHKALSNKVFSDEEFLEQANYVLQERLNLLDYARRRYDDGLLFFYFSSTDLQSHMFWWNADTKHPVRSAAEAKKYNRVIEKLYGKMDTIVGDTMRRYPDATILVMSDHGFCNFGRQFNLNTWLRDEGYLGPGDCASLLDPRKGLLVDWSLTRAYGLGINGLYLNQAGRERFGIVSPAERDSLLEELREKLLAVRDPMDGQQVITAVYRSDQIYHGPEVQKAPDLIVGYRRGYRSSWGTALGTITDEVFSDNDEAWGADHCMATEELPGVCFSTKPILHNEPSLIDLAPTILEEFGLTPPKTITGSSIFKPAAEA